MTKAQPSCGYSEGWEQIKGLILEKATMKSNENVYRRVGVFMNPWGSDYTPQDRGEFPVFLHVNLENDVSEEITIA
jgi:hypothetical protein